MSELVDKDSVFNNLDAEKEQYSFINYQLAKIYYEGLKDSTQANTHFQSALKYILLTKDKSQQKEYIAQVHRDFALNCLKLDKLDKARINLEYALEFYLE